MPILDLVRSIVNQVRGYAHTFQFSECYVLMQSDDIGNAGKVDGQTLPDYLEAPPDRSRSDFKLKGNIE